MMDDFQKMLMIFETGFHYPALERHASAERTHAAHTFAVGLIAALVINMLRIFAMKGLNQVSITQGLIQYLHGHVAKYGTDADKLELPPPPDDVYIPLN